LYLMYVDESGDSGLGGSPLYVLCGVVVHELRWRQSLDQIIDFRRRMKQMHGLPMREEIHAGQFIQNQRALPGIQKHIKLGIMRAFADELATMPDLSVITILIDKRNKRTGYDVFEMGWKALLQRFENGIVNRNLKGPQNPDERGIILPDNTDTTKVTKILRKMRRFNPIPSRGGGASRNTPVQMIVEDPSFRDSRDSYFIQAADLGAFLLYQKTLPCGYIRRKHAVNYFDRLNPVLYIEASRTDIQGIVRL